MKAWKASFGGATFHRRVFIRKMYLYKDDFWRSDNLRKFNFLKFWVVKWNIVQHYRHNCWKRSSFGQAGAVCKGEDLTILRNGSDFFESQDGVGRHLELVTMRFSISVMCSISRLWHSYEFWWRLIKWQWFFPNPRWRRPPSLILYLRLPYYVRCWSLDITDDFSEYNEEMASLFRKFKMATTAILETKLPFNSGALSNQCSIGVTLVGL